MEGEEMVARRHHYRYHPHVCRQDAGAWYVGDSHRGAYGQQEGSH